MRPLKLLKCLARALVRCAGNVLGLGIAGDVVVEVAGEAWREWKRYSDEPARRAEMAALVQMAAHEFRDQVEEVVREVAAGQPPEVRQGVSRWLEALPDRLRLSLARPGDPTGQSVLPHLSLAKADDLVSLLTPGCQAPAGSAASPPEPALPQAARVVLTLADGKGPERQFVFEGRTTCIIGREDRCHPRFPSDEQHRTISRFHCLLDVNPPDLCVRDLGSLGGTFVNGELLDRRPDGMERDEALKLRFRERDLHDGDEVRLCARAAVFRVSVTIPVRCAGCGVWAPEGQRGVPGQGLQTYLCEACHAQPTAAVQAAPRRSCARCGRDVGSESGANRPGDLVCTACRNQLLNDVPQQTQEDAGLAVPGYTILRELGRGGMGSVWLARHDRTGRPAAIKIMLPRVAADERAVNRFLHEAANTRVLNHPNVVRLEDAGYARGVFYMVLDYCDGGSVAGLMEQRGGCLPTDEAGEITLQALEGLHYAHNVFGPGNGLVHRDLKPANLFLSGAGSSRVARVGDYGLAKAFDDAGLSGATRTGEVGGTPLFMARRQVIDFKYAKPEVDVWAMAASLYAMLTGVPPRDFPPGRDPWMVILDEPAVPIRRRKPSLPEGLAAVIDRALVEEPEAPYKTAAELKEALESAL